MRRQKAVAELHFNWRQTARKRYFTFLKGARDGSSPAANVIADSAGGNLYGTTGAGEDRDVRRSRKYGIQADAGREKRVSSTPSTTLDAAGPRKSGGGGIHPG